MDAGRGVGGAGPAGAEHDAGPAGDLADRLGRHGGATLLPADGELECMQDRISLTVGVVAVAISVLIGAFLGGIAGFYGGIVDNIIMRIVDIFMCFPSLPLLIMFGSNNVRFKITTRV